MTIKQILSEPLKINKRFKGEEVTKKVLELLKIVGLDEQHLYRFPHEFSGGQKQRIGVARAIALNPDFIVLDEPTSSLDVSVQAQILNLLKDLQEKFGLTYLFITHDLSVIKFISDRVAVMYAGKIVEYAKTLDLFRDPTHPYTKALLSAIPIPDPRLRSKHIHLKGEVPSLITPPTGCRFHPRCPEAKPGCSKEEPQMKEIYKDHFVACF
jgi:oligopeptide/dipeptide ABC transporter ATP-binding protein